jgi:hypothetical protein
MHVLSGCAVYDTGTSCRTKREMRNTTHKGSERMRWWWDEIVRFNSKTIQKEKRKTTRRRGRAAHLRPSTPPLPVEGTNSRSSSFYSPLITREPKTIDPPSIRMLGRRTSFLFSFLCQLRVRVRLAWLMMMMHVSWMMYQVLIYMYILVTIMLYSNNISQFTLFWYEFHIHGREERGRGRKKNVRGLRGASAFLPSVGGTYMRITSHHR